MKVFLKFIDHDEIHGSNLDFLKKFCFLLFFLYITYFYLNFLIIDRGDLYFFSHVT
jgi:hypothetical protein